MAVESIMKPFRQLFGRLWGSINYQKEITFGPTTVSIPDGRILDGITWFNNEFNMTLAKEHGISPVSLQQILDQLIVEQGNLILFDSPGSSEGNHWRILSRDEVSTSLQLTNTSGSYDYHSIPPIIVPESFPMFTGVLIPHLKLDGNPISLADAVPLLKSRPDLINESETILWSNAEGRLIDSAMHPFFQK